MPIMLRTSSKAKKIAYKLLGNPLAGSVKSPKNERIRRRLLMEETARVR